MEELEDAKDYIQFQKVTDNAESVWWMFSILLKEKVKHTRDEVMAMLKEDGIETRPLFYPMHEMPVYKDDNANCPVCERVAARGMNLPTHALLTREDVTYICNKLKEHIMG